MTTTQHTAPVGFADGAERLGLTPPDVAELVDLRAAGTCAPVQRRMAEMVAARLAQVHARLGDALAEQAAAGGVGGADVESLTRGIPLAKDAGRLQAAAGILADPPTAGGCADDCACTRAVTVTAGPYLFGTTAVTAQGQPFVCTLDADGS